MKNLTTFCLTLEPKHEKIITNLGFIPVGLGNEIFPKSFFSDKTGDNISHKNPYYGEYTFHYWLWKNYLNKIDTEWVGFCQYRKFFLLKEIIKKDIILRDLESIIKKIDSNKVEYDCILGNNAQSRIINFQNHKTSFFKFILNQFY